MDSIDFLEPACPEDTARSSHRKVTEGALLPKDEYTLSHVKEVLQKIQHLCSARGELVAIWMNEYMEMVKRSGVDFARTWEATRILADRLMRGEFLLLFSDRSGLINIINPLFAPDVVIVCKGKDKSAISRPRRPTVPADRDLILSKSIYFQARLPAPESLTREDFRNAILAISNAFRGHYPELANEAKDWEMTVLKAGKDVGGTRWNFRGNKSKVMRWKLIVVGEKVRTGEKLPKVEDLLHGHIEPPQNVDPEDACFVRSETTHSLGRIGLRQARRIGYFGPAARDGGIEFV